jgi:hypothetical protein
MQGVWMHRIHLLAAACGLAAALVLAGCAHVPAAAPPVERAPPVPAPAPAAAPELPAWIELGPQPIARAVIVPGAPCPPLVVDGQAQPTALRVAAGTPPQRPTADKPAAFPIDVCEATLAPGAQAVRLGKRLLAPLVAEPRRIVVLGDTGCRIKGSVVQACTDPEGWPFAQLARTAAALKPELVIHVGDYHYRETPCPADAAGCAGSPWGYGWDAWDADFFAPAQPLLAAAPWIFVRGNHEECERAGQGWFRLLAPEPWSARRSCDSPADDDDANYSAPYAVPIGATAQLVVFDSAHAGNRPLDLARPADAAIHRHFVAGMKALDALAQPDRRSWFASHHPILGFAPDPDAPQPHPGNAPLLQAMAALNGTVYFPPGVQLALHGHVHLFQALAFDDGHPATLVAGNGGDRLDPALPDPMPAGSSPAAGVHLAQATYGDAFGFLLIERAEDDGRWTISARRRDGSEMTRCTLAADGRLACTPHGWLR